MTEQDTITETSMSTLLTFKRQGNDLLSEIKQSDTYNLMSIASRPDLPIQAQEYIATHITAEAVLEKLAYNPAIHREIQQLIAEQGSRMVRISLMLNAALAPDVQQYIFNHYPLDETFTLFNNSSLCEEVQFAALKTSDARIISILLESDYVKESVQRFVVESGVASHLCYLACNPTLSLDLFDKIIEHDNYEINSLNSRYTLANSLLSNHRLPEKFVNQLIEQYSFSEKNPACLLVDILSNAVIPESKLASILIKVSHDYIDGRGIYEQMACDERLTESRQLFMLKKFGDVSKESNKMIIGSLASNPNISPACQRVLLKYNDVKIFEDILCNDNCTPAVEQLIVDILGENKELKSLFLASVEGIKESAWIWIRSLRSQGTKISDEGIILEPKCTLDIDDGERIVNLFRQYDFLMTIYSGIK